MQRDLFQSDEVVMLEEKIAKVESVTANSTRGLFARYNHLERKMLELEEIIFQMKKHALHLHPSWKLEESHLESHGEPIHAG